MFLTEVMMQKMNEEDLRKTILIPLLEQMGYRGVFEWHGRAGELGKDIVGWKEDDLGNRRNLAVVAKAVNISGDNAVNNVVRQVIQCFSTPFQDPFTGEDQRVHTVWIITNRRAAKESRAILRSSLHPDRLPYVDILDGGDLWRLVKKYLPISPHQAISELEKHLTSLNTDYDIEVHLNTGGLTDFEDLTTVRTHSGDVPIIILESEDRRIIVTEKYPGQLDEQPFVLQANFSFPDTPDGQAKLLELQNMFASGASAEIPGAFVEVKHPAVVDQLSEQLLGFRPIGVETISVLPLADHKKIPVRIDIQCDDGDQSTLDYVEWMVVQAGRDEITLMNDAQMSPVRVKHVIRRKGEDIVPEGKIHFSRRPEPIAAPILVRFLHLMECLAKAGTICVTMLETDRPLFIARREAHPDTHVDSEFVAAMKDLARIQERLGQVIYIPDRDFTEEEEVIIHDLRMILNHGELNGRWSGTIPLAFPRSTVEKLLSNIETPLALGLESLETIRIFETDLPLGKVRAILQDARIANEQEMRQQLDRTDNETPIPVALIPGDKNTCVKRFLDWLP